MSDKSSATPKLYDLVVFGASGFAGKFVAERLARNVPQNRRWAVAGRSDRKLRTVLDQLSKSTGKDLGQIETIMCDVENVESLKHMASLTKVVLNCVGPYRLYGEPVVKACVENGTSCVDLSGEPNFLESMCVKYHDRARASGSYVVGACGWDSIPCDIGVQYAADNFQGTLHCVETFHEVSAPNGLCLNTGTWESLILGVANRAELQSCRKSYNEKFSPAPKTYPKLSKRYFFYDERVKGWCLPFLGSDRSVVQRSTAYHYAATKKRPIQIETYLKCQNFFTAILLIIWAALFFVMAIFQCGRNLLKKYPRVFTCGTFSDQGPSKLQLDTTSFRLYILGQGWTNGVVPTSAPNGSIKCTLSGGEPGYVATSTTMVAAALTLLEDQDKLPQGGGVFTTSSAFSKTKLIQRLESMGVHFKID